nr:crinkler 11 [Plasmopara viticola]
MVKLFCAIVDGAGSAFSVRVDESDSVDELKDAIKKKKPDTIKGEADKLQLFLTKTNDGAWLESDSEDVKKLKKGKKSIAIKALTGEDKELQGESGLQKVLAGMSKPSTDQIHVLVVVPKPEQALWLITGFVENAMYSKRIRSYLHWMATFRIGYYDPVLRTQNKNVAFWYEGKNLCLHLLFETSACSSILSFYPSVALNRVFCLQKRMLCYSKLT